MQRVCVFFLMLSIGVPIAGQAQTAGSDAPQLFEKGMAALAGSQYSQSGANAIEFLRHSADLGYSPAQVVLGYFYETGTFTPKDPAQALSLYKKAAQQDDPLAEWMAGRLIFAAVVPPRDLNDAGSLFKASAQHGNAFAEYLLGKVNLERQQFAQAAQSFRQAAEQGLPQAQLQLARLLRDGRGVQMDRSQAYVWMLLSNDAGNADAAQDLQQLEASLGTTEIDHGKSRAQELEGTTNRAVAAHGCTGWPGEFSDIPAPPPPDLQRFCR
jgi:TPR repeat protein